MKNKILFRLTLYFTGSFVIFSLIISVIFFFLFSRRNMIAYRNELEKRAVSMADTFSDYFESGAELGLGQGQGQGYGAFLRFVEDIAMCDVWIVDRNREQIVFGHGQANLPYKDLPEGAEQVISAAFEGTTGETFSGFLETPTVMAAAPILLTNGEVAGVVLLHSQVDPVRGTTESGLLILAISVTAGILLSVLVAGLFASHFTKPLHQMKNAAIGISGGDYAVRTGVAQTDEIGELASAMDAMVEKLKAASLESNKLENLRRSFIANITHELRTPVTVIRGSLEALCDGVVSDAEKVSEYHRQMLNESFYLERLVTDLLDLARLQNPDFRIEKSEVDLKELTGDTVRGMRQIAGKKQVELCFACEDKPFSFTGDYGRLRQMLLIVLDNAVKFSPSGGIVTIQLTAAEDKNTLSVCDEGDGIPPEVLPHIFERFFNQRSEQNKSGTGLGLAIAKEIADRHDIHIEVNSDVGKGTEFVFVFPL